LGPIDVLVNNAGDYLADSVLDVSNSRAEDLMKVNLLAPMRLVRGILPSMLEQKVGVIVNISSLVSFCPAPYMVDYGASKSGLATYSESLGAELKGTGVHVVTVYPGPVSTSMEHAAKGKLSSPVAQLLPTGNAEELAFKILQAVRARTTRVIYPRVYETTRMFGVLSEYLSLRFGPRPKA